MPRKGKWTKAKGKAQRICAQVVPYKITYLGNGAYVLPKRGFLALERPSTTSESMNRSYYTVKNLKKMAASIVRSPAQVVYADAYAEALYRPQLKAMVDASHNAKLVAEQARQVRLQTSAEQASKRQNLSL